MSQFSPYRGYRLEMLEGNPDDIERAGNEYTRMGERMQWTADELGNLSSETRYKAEGLDAIREKAGKLSTDLGKVADRYTQSGPVLVTYAGAIRDAQTRTVNPLVDELWAAIDAQRVAEENAATAQSEAEDLQNPLPWQDEATDAELARAAEDSADAQAAARTAAAELEGLWQSFESGYSVWESAYEAAVRDLETAYTTSGLDDNPWEDFFDGFAQALTIIGTIAIVVAIFATGPLAVLALVVATIAAIATLVIHVGMMVAGSSRVTMGDIFFDTIAVVPFIGGVAKAMKGTTFFRALAPAAGVGTTTPAAITAGRNAVENGVRTIVGFGGSGGGQAARAAQAGGLADDFLRNSVGSWGQNAWNAIRSGGARLDGLALNMSERLVTAWPTSGVARRAATDWADEIGAAGRFMQGINVGNFANGIHQSVSIGAGWFGAEIPTVADLPFVNFNPLAR